MNIIGSPGVSAEKPLPEFRKDLVVYPGPPEMDGSPTYNLYDPVRAQYFKLNWSSYLVYKNLEPGMTMSQLMNKIQQQSTLKVTKEEVELFFGDANVNKLLLVNYSSSWIIDEAEKLKVGWFMWLIYHYLYIRIPLFNPNNFLDRTLKYVRLLFTNIAIKIYIAITALGILFLLPRLDDYFHTFTYFFNLQGLIIYATGITLVKVVHEFSHAYTAKYYKTYVPSMGIALIVFWPVLYTDVTDSWRLASRKQRLAISIAGIVAELILAGISTLLWTLTPPGTLQSVFFVISSATWISTLLVNLNPALRFDGYYLLADIWGIDNMQPRVFAVTRWKLRQYFLGINVPAPEEHLTRKRIVGMMVYSIYTWIYRIGLYTTIAIFVYHNFTKMLGIFLFLLEIGIFLVWPAIYEIEQVYKLRSFITINFRSIFTFLAIVAVLIWFFMPLPHDLKYTALSISNPQETQEIYVPVDAFVKDIYVKRDETVKIDQKLITLFSEVLLANLAQAKLDLDIAEKESVIVSGQEKSRPELAEKEANKNHLRETIKGYEAVLNQLDVKSHINGSIYAWDDSLRKGQYLSKDQILGAIANLDKIYAIGFVPESNINDLQVGQVVNFQLLNTLENIPGTVIKISPVRAQALLYPQLASTNQGDLPVSPDPLNGQRLLLVESYYPVYILLDSKEPIQIGQKGNIWAEGPWKSNFMNILREVQALLWREGTP